MKTREQGKSHTTSEEKRVSKGIEVCFVCRDDSEVSAAHLEALMDALPSSDRLPCGLFLNSQPDRQTGELKERKKTERERARDADYVGRVRYGR